MEHMVYDILSSLFRKHLYIIFNERYKSDVSATYIERYVAKHPLLKPELIMVGDQPHGFKKTSEHVASLEKFPIYAEVEFVESPEGEKYVENVDLYAEAKIKCKDRLSDVIHIANLYSKTVILERVKQINDPSSESLFIYSRFGELFLEEYLEEDLEEGLVNESELTLMLEVHIASFTNFIKVLDDVVVKGKHLNTIDQLYNPL
jgi:hypothetical protein